MSDTAADPSVSIRLSAQRALWGAIPPRLRAVSVELIDHTIRMRSIFDGGPTDAEREALSIAGTEMVADFTTPFVISEEMLSVPYPAEMQHLRWLIYLRNESKFRWVYVA
jgi:hypothetical protein